MTITPKIQKEINRLISTVSFPPDPTSSLTPKDRVQRLDKELKKMLGRLFDSLVEWKCTGCDHTEHLFPALMCPMHRHGKHLYMLYRPTS